MSTLPRFDESHERFGATYRTLLSHVVSGEAVGIEHYAQMIPIARSLEERVALLEDAWSEKRHLQSILSVASALGVTAHVAIDDEYWGVVRAAFRARAAASDLAACYVIQDVVLECLAVTFYEALIPGVQPGVAARLAAIARDEREHLEHGTAIAAEFFAADRSGFAERVEYANERVGRPLAEWLRPRDCQPVCGVCSITRGSCFKESLELVDVDLKAARGGFTALYGKTLRDIGFSPAEVTRWIARLV